MASFRIFFLGYGTDQTIPVGKSPAKTKLVRLTTLSYHLTSILANNFSSFDFTLSPHEREAKKSSLLWKMFTFDGTQEHINS